MFAARKFTATALTGARQAHSLPNLPYDFNALEPVISRDIMSLHYQKHHAAYVTNLNAAEENMKSAIEKGDVSKVAALTSAINFNGGGHINHSIFWQNLSPCSTKPSDKLIKAINNDFKSIDNMKTMLSTATVGIQGSGWGWLGYNKLTNKLQIATCANQDALLPHRGLIPLLGIDVWEHAYYLQYKNVRADYVKAIFDIVNWEDVSQRYESSL